MEGEEVKTVGFSVTVKVLLPRKWWSWCLPDRYGRCLGVGPLHIWFSTEREDKCTLR
jgi:hypothetical protein